jgi:hypothetical protein
VLSSDSDAAEEDNSSSEEELDSDEFWARYPDALAAATGGADGDNEFGLDSDGDCQDPEAAGEELEPGTAGDEQQQHSGSQFSNSSCDASKAADDSAEPVPPRGTPAYRKWLLKQPVFPGERACGSEFACGVGNHLNWHVELSEGVHNMVRASDPMSKDRSASWQQHSKCG